MAQISTVTGVPVNKSNSADTANIIKALHKSTGMTSMTEAAGIYNIHIDFLPNSVSVRDKNTIKKLFDEIASKGVVPSQDFCPYADYSVIKCFETEEVRGVILCFFNSQHTMNEVLQRTNFFIEQTQGMYLTKAEFFSNGPFERSDMFGNVVTREDINNNRSFGLRGFDLPGEKINKFLDYHAKDNSFLLIDKNSIMEVYSDMEDKFLSLLSVVRRLYGDDYTLITAVTDSSFTQALSHEYLHAQYFALPEFKKNVDAYTKTQEGKKEFELLIKYFKTKFYPVIEEDTVLRNNEFMAFLLGTDMYENSYKKWPVVAAVSRMLLLPPSEITENDKMFFNELYTLWKKNNFGANGGVSDLEAQSQTIKEKYGSPTPPDVENSEFVRYLTEHGTPPVIIK